MSTVVILPNGQEALITASVDANGNLVTDSSGGSAVNVVAELTNLGNTLGLYTPARDYYLDYFWGTDDAFITTEIAAGSETMGSILDMREINPNARSIVIQTSDATAIDFTYTVYFSRSGIDADKYTTSLTAQHNTTGVDFVRVNVPASVGYDLYIHLGINPAAGQTAANRKFRAYLVGKGG